MKILFASAEAAPLAMVGGLGDVAGALPGALRRLGLDVRVALPRYRCVDDRDWLIEALPSPAGAATVPLRLGQTALPDGTPVYLVGEHRYFDRSDIYGYDDDAVRFAYFSRACVALPAAIGWAPDVIHCHDWHTALVPQLLAAAGPEAPVSVLTIHNLAHQGVTSPDILDFAGLEAAVESPPLPGERPGAVNLLARGVRCCNAVTTVSPTYAREILTPEQGAGLVELLWQLPTPPVGILNGIDTGEYDPRSDPFIAARYGPDCLDRKAENKAALQRELGLDVAPRAPLVGVVARLVEQKGVDLLAAVLDPLCRFQPIQLALLGSGEVQYHRIFNEAAARHPGRIGVRLGFDPALARRIYAGADMFLMPSRFEPCGLGQMIALRYGTVPVVRRTGGLADTVADCDAAGEHGNGFVFDVYDPQALYRALARAITVFGVEAAWRRLMLRGMAVDHSWSRSAEGYAELYHAALERRGLRC